jgi:Fe-S cluster assembly ATP-binding protein
LFVIKNLSVKIADKLVLDNLCLSINAGALDVLMGPNGSGKSSLAATIMGNPDYQVVAGTINFAGQDITQMLPHERAKLGLFLAFQNPIAIQGLQVFSFLKTIYEAYTGKNVLALEFESLLNKNLEIVGLNKSFMYRDVNDGFSGGERKRFEILQLILLKPKLAIIDEIDSGLDIDALKIIAQVLAFMQQDNPDLTIILITHYNRILSHLKTNLVHVLQAGKLIKSGGLALISQIEANGYEELL